MNTETAVNVEKLAETLIEKVNTIPFSMRFGGIKTIANMFECGITTATALTKRPDFPGTLRLPTKQASSHPRWQLSEVLEWAKKYKTKNAEI